MQVSTSTSHKENTMQLSTHLNRIAQVCGSALLLQAGNVAAQNAPLDGLVKSAGLWASMADANQPERMWDTSGPIMQKNMAKQDWGRYLVNLRSELGPLQSRQWVQVARVVNPTGLPPGEYMNVMFSSTFAKAATIEKVSLTQSAGKWIPVGYVVNRAEPPQASAAPAAPPAR
jgi:hypothetical protein